MKLEKRKIQIGNKSTVDEEEEDKEDGSKIFSYLALVTANHSQFPKKILFDGCLPHLPFQLGSEASSSLSCYSLAQFPSSPSLYQHRFTCSHYHSLVAHITSYLEIHGCSLSVICGHSWIATTRL